MLILKFRKYNNSLYKLSSDFQIVTVLGLQFIIFILQQLHNLITTALLMANLCHSDLLFTKIRIMTKTIKQITRIMVAINANRIMIEFSSSVMEWFSRVMQSLNVIAISFKLV